MRRLGLTVVAKRGTTIGGGAGLGELKVEIVIVWGDGIEGMTVSGIKFPAICSEKIVGRKIQKKSCFRELRQAEVGTRE